MLQIKTISFDEKNGYKKNINDLFILYKTKNDNIFRTIG